MVAVNNAFAVLVYRYTIRGGLPPGDNIWDSFPFNIERFREISGIESAEVGLSKPPVGRLGQAMSSATRSLWPRKAAGAVKFLQHCDAQRRRMGDNVVIESFQKDVLKVAPGVADWEWVVSHTFDAPGGLYERLRDLMCDNKCDAEEAYRQAREEWMTLMADEFEEGKVPGATKFDTVWLPARTAIGRAVLGDPQKTGRVALAYYPTLRALCFRRFEPAARNIVKNASKIDALEQKLKKAYDLANDKPTLKNLRMATTLHGSVISIQRALGVRGSLEENGPWRRRLDELMAQLGRKKGKNGAMTRVAARHPKAHLVSDEDLDAAWREYRAEIWVATPSGAGGVDQEVTDDRLAEGPLAGLNAFPLHPGLQRTAKMSTVEIKKMLLVPDSGLPGARRNDDGTLSMEGMWHQWTGAAELINGTFVEQGGTGRPSVVADEVGMGKTAQAILYIQLLWHLKSLQDSNPNWPNTDSSDGIAKWPEFLGDRKFFMGLDRIPAIPTLIMAPTTLITQWRTDVDAWLSDTACHRMTFRGNEQARKAFFEEGSPYDQAMKSNNPERTIIFVEAPSVLAEGRIELSEPGDRARGDPSSGHPDHIAKTIFGQRFSTIILEEGHLYRNPGINQRTVMTLMSRCEQRLILTATPVFTHPRDLLSLGRLLRAPRFIGSPGVELTRLVESQFKESSKNWDSDSEQEKLRGFLLSLRGQPSPSDSESTDNSQILELLPSQEEDWNSYRAFWNTRAGLFTLREAMKEYMIRRDERSVDCNGKPLLGLLPKLEITSYIKLNLRTEAALRKETATKEDRSRARMDLDGFFTRNKKALVHPDLLLPRKDGVSLEEHMRKLFPTIESYKARPSPKIDRLLRILNHHVGPGKGSSKPLYWDVEGNETESDDLFYAQHEDDDEEAPDRKVIVYCHLSQSWTLVAHILKLHGHDTVMINGSMEPAQRDASVKAFQAEGGPSVMLLSDVGAQGLNLQRASVLVFVDHPWSASEAQQICGRVQRRGQTRQVIIYRLVAPNTPDEFLLGYASGKKLMMQVFTEACQTRGLPGFEHEEKEAELPEEEDKDPPPPPQPRKRPKKSAAPPKAMETNVEPDTLGTNAEDPSQADVVDPPTTGVLNSPTTDAVNPPKTDKKSTAPKASKRTKPPKESKPKAEPKPKVERYFHPDFPGIGPQPADGTKRRDLWDKKVIKKSMEKAKLDMEMQARVQEQVAQFVGQMKARVEQIQAETGASNNDPAPGTESSNALPDVEDKNKGKGKGKGLAEQSASQVHPTQSQPNFTPRQTVMFTMISEGIMDIAGAQSMLATMGELPLPNEWLPQPSTPVASGSGSANSSAAPQHSTLSSDIVPARPSTPPPVAGEIHGLMSPSSPEQRRKRQRTASAVNSVELAESTPTSSANPSDRGSMAPVVPEGHSLFDKLVGTSTPRHRTPSTETQPAPVHILDTQQPPLSPAPSPGTMLGPTNSMGLEQPIPEPQLQMDLDTPSARTAVANSPPPHHDQQVSVGLGDLNIQWGSSQAEPARTRVDERNPRVGGSSDTERPLRRLGRSSPTPSAPEPSSSTAGQERKKTSGAAARDLASMIRKSQKKKLK